MTKFEAVLVALLARDNEYPTDLEQKNMVKAEFPAQRRCGVRVVLARRGKLAMLRGG